MSSVYVKGNRESVCPFFKLNTQLNDVLSYYTVEDKSNSRANVNKKFEYVKKIKLYYYNAKEKTYYFPAGTAMNSFMCKRYSDNIKYIGRSLWPEQEYIMCLIKTNNTGLINMSTASGKSTVIANIIAEYGLPVVVLCHNVQTTIKMYQDLQDNLELSPNISEGLSEPAGVGIYYGDKKKLDYVTVVTHASFVDSNSIIKGHITSYGLPYVILYDECDVNLSKDMIHCLSTFGNSALFGLTGTPYRQDLNTDDMTKVYGPVLQAPASVLQRQGKIGRYYYIPKFVKLRYNTKVIYSSGTDFTTLRTEMFEDDSRTLSQLDALKNIIKTRDKVLVLTERRQEAEKYIDMINKYYPDFKNVYLITGKTTPKNDAQVVAQMAVQDKYILIATVQKIGRGVDIPTIDTICIYFANTFSGTIVQAVGRALRKQENKKDVVVYDWHDHLVGIKHMLDTQSYKRTRAYKEEYGKDIVIEQIDIYPLENKTPF